MDCFLWQKVHRCATKIVYPRASDCMIVNYLESLTKLKVTSTLQPLPQRMSQMLNKTLRPLRLAMTRRPHLIKTRLCWKESNYTSPTPERQKEKKETSSEPERGGSIFESTMECASTTLLLKRTHMYSWCEPRCSLDWK